MTANVRMQLYNVCEDTMFKKKTLPFLFFKLIDQIHFAFLGACQLGFDLLQVALGLCYILNEIRKKRSFVLQKFI